LCPAEKDGLRAVITDFGLAGAVNKEGEALLPTFAH
jgi:hypothetical protein